MPENEYHYHGKPCKNCGSTLRYIKCNHCVLCMRKRIQKWAKNNPEKKDAHRRKYYRNNRKRFLQYKKEYSSTNKEKIAAQVKIGCEVSAGRMANPQSLSCADCGKTAKDYHHESYAKKDHLNVIPLCRSCHVNRHKQQIEQG